MLGMVPRFLHLTYWLEAPSYSNLTSLSHVSGDQLYTPPLSAKELLLHHQET